MFFFVGFVELLGDRGKAGAVVGRDPVGVESLKMLGGGVAFVFCPVVGRVLLVEGGHNSVSGCFGEDGRAGDGEADAIPFDDGLAGDC